ncbi:SHC-transforming protein 4 isoform X3 [Balaenoptera musculus]|uniref:SHC-transforming protein 4 isoform X3 n=1 Tax=Balaenoptera musculus TaxID=9771 RepID=A0A8B8WQG2_BALMU|nr:SHC-transforming protein 4 isoform X3 [Balaenoptera musculus]
MHLKPAIQSCFSCSGGSQKHLVGFFKGRGYSVACTTQLLLFRIVVVVLPVIEFLALVLALEIRARDLAWLLPRAGPAGEASLPQRLRHWLGGLLLHRAFLLQLWLGPGAGGVQGWLPAPAAYLHLRKVTLARHHIHLQVIAFLIELGQLVHFRHCASGSTSPQGVFGRIGATRPCGCALAQAPCACVTLCVCATPQTPPTPRSAVWGPAARSSTPGMFPGPAGWLFVLSNFRPRCYYCKSSYAVYFICFWRGSACHILECSNGMAQDVISTIGQAFELRFKQYLKNPSLNTSSESEEVHVGDHAEEREDHEYYNEIPGKQPPAGGVSDVRVKVQATEQTAYCPIRCEKLCYLPGNSKCSSVYENCLEQSRAIGNAHERGMQSQRDTSLMKPACRVDLFDDPCYINTQTLQSTLGSAGNQSPAHPLGSPWYREKAPETVQPGATAQPASSHSLPHIKQQLRNEDCYHGKLSRKAAESLLVKDGDFLVRESATSPGQYVLSGLQGGQAKHLLLVDPEGKVRTKDHVFDNVGHLIRYHMDNSLPIISSGSEVSLKQPVRKDNNPVLLHSNK